MGACTLMGKEYYEEQLRVHLKRFYRRKSDKRATKHQQKQRDFFEHAGKCFGISVTYNFNKKKPTVSISKFKITAAQERRNVAYPVALFPQRRRSAAQA